jgi:LPS-assembly lipoprotein
MAVKRLALTILAGLLLTALAGCGFQLRGVAQLPFDSAHVEALPGSVLAPLLRDSLSSQHKLAARADAAAVRILLAEESRTKSILALSEIGRAHV